MAEKLITHMHRIIKFLEKCLAKGEMFSWHMSRLYKKISPQHWTIFLCTERARDGETGAIWCIMPNTCEILAVFLTIGGGHASVWVTESSLVKCKNCSPEKFCWRLFTADNPTSNLHRNRKYSAIFTVTPTARSAPILCYQHFTHSNDRPVVYYILYRRIVKILLLICRAWLLL